MAHFAKIGPGSIVEKVEVVKDSIATDEAAGITFLKNLYNDQNSIWKQTSYNTRGGKYYNADGTEGDQSNALRKNFAGEGFTYDNDADAFIPPRPFDSWTLNTTTYLWESPVGDAPITYNQGRLAPDSTALPDIYKWDELRREWIEVGNH